MRRTDARAGRMLTALVVAALLGAATLAPPASASPRFAARPLVVARHGRDVVTTFRTLVRGEVLGAITASAPGVSWQQPGAQSAVVRVIVDGRYVTDDVVMESTPITRWFDLGTLPGGVHVVHLRFDVHASSPRATIALVENVHYRAVPAGTRAFVELSHSPVLYGRNGTGVSPDRSGPYQNAVTDTPLVAWHEDTPGNAPGVRHLTYSIVWSNEDGGTSTPALMARWGRTTDIEWIYQVDVDAAGRTIPGTAVFQSAGHGTGQFAGTYEHDHPLLQTCTLNNNVCDTVDDPMRFALSTATPLDPTIQAREQVMDANPWTYHVMAQEMRREGNVVADPDPGQTTFIADPRDYLYLIVRKQTLAANNGIFWVGVAIGVRLKHDPTLYRSDHGMHDDWSLQRDDPAATTVQLPPGTTPSDVAEIDAIRQNFGPDTGASVQVQAVNRTFFLGPHDRPQPSFFSGSTPALLTQQAPLAVLYRSP